MDVQSCRQFQYVFSTIHSPLYSQVVELIIKPIPKHNIHQKRVITQFLNKLIGQANSAVIMPTDVAQLDDYHIYTQLHQLMNTHVYPTIGYPQNENYGRSISRVHDIMLLLRTLHIPIHSNIRFVDIGCSMGEITKELAQALHTPYGIGIDVLHSSQVIHNNTGTPTFKYICVTPTHTRLPLDDASQDIVTAIMSLHHIQQVDAYLSEIHRILKPEGVLIIQEHDPQSPDDAVALDILHGLYSMVWAKTGEQEQPFFCQTYDAVYFSRQQLQEKLVALGFQLHTPKHNYKAIPKYNPFGNYWCVALK